MKYNVNLDNLDVNSSHWKILSQISPHSIVLECGCASGYMTKYMSEELHCRVYIVEYEEEAFNVAQQYAAGGFAGDLMSDECFKKFSNLSFDYILFADVLEHLSNPLKVLQKASDLLKPDGQIIVSIPNIGHNDIILKLLSGRWEYTPNGLLDDTHVHFWGIYDLEPFFHEASLCIEKFDATYVPTCQTEQYSTCDHTEILMHSQIIPQLDQRREGEIFQFILTLRKQEYMKARCLSPSPLLPDQNKKGAAMASVYFDLGTGYSETNSEKLFLSKGIAQKYQVTIPANARAIRFDPIENLCCAITDLCIKPLDSNITCSIDLVSAYTCDEYTFFLTSDPQILITPSPHRSAFVLEISMNLIPFIETTKELFEKILHFKDHQLHDHQKSYEKQLREMKEMYDHDFANALTTAQENMKSIIAENNMLKEQVEQANTKLTIEKETVAKQLTQIHSAQEKIQLLMADKSKLQQEIQNKTTQCSSLEMQLTESHKNAQCLMAEKSELQQEIQNKTAQCSSLEIQLAESHKNTQCLMAEKSELQQDVQNHSEQEYQLGLKLTEAHNQNAELHLAYDQLMESYNNVLSSDSWRITVPLRKISTTLRNVAQKSGITALGWRGLINLKQNGFKETWQKTQAYFTKTPKKEEIPLLDTNIVYEENIDFSKYKTDIKALALYLPQYHEFAENNQWWGNGFTEWTNVKKGYSRFENHNQPRVPSDDIGYYDLSDVNSLKKQVLLAKQHGIYGFAIYYYWFSGKRLMEKPMDLLLHHKEINFPFMAVWANENWTRTWDGQANQVLIAQKYNDTDPRQFILDLKKYIDDPRYIRVDGKPVIGLYDPLPIPNVADVLKKWRQTAHEIGIGDILIWVCQCNSNAQVMGVEDLVDGEYEFPPRGKGHVPNCDVPSQGIAYNYQALVESERSFDVSNRKIPVYRGSMMQWDNSARRKTKYNCWINYTPELFYLWNKTEIADLRKRLPENQRFLFINAWNEWGEGTYLEPDKKYGYANINALSRALFDLPLQYNGKCNNKTDEKLPSPEKNRLKRRSPVMYMGGGLPVYTQPNWTNKLQHSCQIAIQAHIFYTDLASEIAEKTNNIPFPFDLYVSTDSEEKAVELQAIFKQQSKARKVQVQVIENKGRDVAPFIRQLSPVIAQYKYFCHIHSKKSLHNESGNIWREYLYENLLGSESIVSEILYLLENDEKLGVVFPENMDVLRPFVEWGSNREIAQGLCGRMGMYDALPSQIHFPAGNMFWGRVNAVNNLFNIAFADSDFPTEGDQIDGTTMHAIERLWLYVASANGYTYQETRSVFDNRPFLS